MEIALKYVLLLFLAVTIESAFDDDDFLLRFRFEDNPRLIRQFAIDISSSSSYVVSAQSNRELEEAFVFNETKSKTFKELGCFRARYDSKFSNFHGICEGIYGSDYIQINDQHRIKTTFGVCRKFDGNPTGGLNMLLIAGRIGLGPDAEKPGSTLRRDIMKTWEEPVLCLATTNRRRVDERVISTGKNLATPENTIVSTQITPKTGFWQFPTIGFSIGTEVFSPISVVLSTTTHYIKVPTKLFGKVIQAFSAFQENNSWYVHCDEEHPSLRLKIGGRMVEILPGDLIEEVIPGKCRLLVNQHNNDYMVVGASVLYTNGVCLNYEMKTVTFYKPEMSRI
ncbi:unnamed protein product [Bursaphelenchus xylophilus]|uniref:(pine wood nematode) hypothetical protein n=1 Tax=Bursaphelenchus xylophilus TaxID=6326 RepID=A0A1I7SS63_BURXY|nr:unnamed protein product [Bursaphelenchus xylophilus]CAG9105598.1 unnamed protein product [Bursaphelenchus xylophilus]